MANISGISLLYNHIICTHKTTSLKNPRNWHIEKSVSLFLTLEHFCFFAFLCAINHVSSAHICFSNFLFSREKVWELQVYYFEFWNVHSLQNRGPFIMSICHSALLWSPFYTLLYMCVRATVRKGPKLCVWCAFLDGPSMHDSRATDPLALCLLCESTGKNFLSTRSYSVVDLIAYCKDQNNNNNTGRFSNGCLSSPSC